MSARQQRRRGDTTIVRVERTQPHVAIPNATVRDTRISLQALGLLAFVLSLPDDWTFRGVRWLAKTRKVGRGRIGAAIRELRRGGYCRVTRDRDGRGRIGTTVYLFRDVRGAADLPPVTVAGFSSHGKSSHGKLATTNPESTKTESTKTESGAVQNSHCDDSALRALEDYGEDLALALGVNRHVAEAWTLDMVRRVGSAAKVRAGLDRAMPRIRAGVAGGPPAKTRGAVGRGRTVETRLAPRRARGGRPRPRRVRARR